MAPFGGVADADAAIAAARAAFDAGPWPSMSVRERIGYLQKMYDVLESRAAEICELIVLEAGSVQSNAKARQFDIPMKHFRRFLELALRQDVRALAPELTRRRGSRHCAGHCFRRARTGWRGCGDNALQLSVFSERGQGCCGIGHR